MRIHMHTRTLLAVMQYTLIITYNLHFGVLALSFYHYLSKHIPLFVDVEFLFSKFVNVLIATLLCIATYVCTYLYTKLSMIKTHDS